MRILPWLSPFVLGPLFLACGSSDSSSPSPTGTGAAGGSSAAGAGGSDIAQAGHASGSGGASHGGAGHAGGAAGASGGGAGHAAGSAGKAAGGAAGAGSTGGAANGGASVGGASNGGATTAGTGGVNGTPTVSSWMGTNISADLPRVDITYQMAPFDTPAAQLDPNGYPMPGVGGKSSQDLGFLLTTGTYKISYKGTGTVTVSGIAELMGGFTASGDEQRGQLQITGSPGNFGQFLTLEIKNDPGQSVTELHIYYPGFDYDSSQVFLPQFLDLLTPFRALRFMDWEQTNNSKLTSWADHPTATKFGQSSFGEPYEHIIELVNETGKDAWITLPELVDDDFVHQLGKLLASNLDIAKINAARAAQGNSAPFQIMVENANETWNMGFSAYATFLAKANADPTHFTGTYDGTYGPSWMSGNSDLMKVGQYEADRLVKLTTILKGELGSLASNVAPVLSGWALGAVYSDVGLRYIKANYGDPNKYVSYIALAPYFGPDDAQTGALDTLFTSANANIQSMDATFQDFQKLATEDSLLIAAYEGGQSLSGQTNQPIKHLAQHDQRMYDAYNAYFALWQKDFGKALFMHFSLAGDPGLPENIYQYGFWGSIIGVLEDHHACAPNLPTLTGTESIDSVVHHCPKYRALAEQVP